MTTHSILRLGLSSQTRIVDLESSTSVDVEISRGFVTCKGIKMESGVEIKGVIERARCTHSNKNHISVYQVGCRCCGKLSVTHDGAVRRAVENEHLRSEMISDAGT